VHERGGRAGLRRCAQQSTEAVCNVLPPTLPRPGRHTHTHTLPPPPALQRQGRGYETDLGVGRGAGFNVNVPWSSKGVGDADYLAAFELLLQPIMSAFAPQIVLVSAGFDAAEGDFLGQCVCVVLCVLLNMTRNTQRLLVG
jgi:acetoin utilization deacetylase AcuC-like enzyme